MLDNPGVWKETVGIFEPEATGQAAEFYKRVGEPIIDFACTTSQGWEGTIWIDEIRIDSASR